MGTTLFLARTSVALKRVENGDVWFLTQRDWCHFGSFVIYSSGAKIEYYRSYISRDILDSVFYIIIHSKYFPASDLLKPHA